MADNRIEELLQEAGATFGTLASKVAASKSGDSVASTTARKPVRTADSGVVVLDEYKLAMELITAGCPVVFVTGGAGTGKSTFIDWLTRSYAGTIVLAAPTGLAALNIGGMTLHRLCGFPASWVVDTDIKRFPQSAVNNADILVIDEISMLNANVLDGLDKFLRKNRRKNVPFGGLTLVLVGDLFQLPPVVTDQLRPLFHGTYSSEKFFAANVLKEVVYYPVELPEALRQTDPEFIQILESLRTGQNVARSVDRLNARCKKSFAAPRGSVWLAPRNAQVEETNSRELDALPGPLATYRAVTVGKFSESSLPVPEHVDLRVGAQVMLKKNIGNYVNGDIGTVEELLDEEVRVRMHADQKLAEFRPEKWEQYEYARDARSGEIERTAVGEYIQIPLMLAWAITIHKSQGMTLSKVHIDLGAGAFASGQTYVGLSRCRSLESLSLTRPITESDIKVDQESRLFYDQLKQLGERVPVETLQKWLRTHN